MGAEQNSEGSGARDFGAEEAAEKPFLPTGRTPADFPVTTEVIVYAMRHSQFELSAGTVIEHTEMGSVVVELVSKARGIPLMHNRTDLPKTRTNTVKVRPGSPGLLKPEELDLLREQPALLSDWTTSGGFYNRRESRRLGQKIRTYTAYEGPPVSRRESPVVSRRRGIRRLSHDQ